MPWLHAYADFWPVWAILKIYLYNSAKSSRKGDDLEEEEEDVAYVPTLLQPSSLELANENDAEKADDEEEEDSDADVDEEEWCGFSTETGQQLRVAQVSTYPTLMKCIYRLI